MKNTKIIIFLSTTIISLLFADLASPTPFSAIQPNGQELIIQNRGNHLQGWHEFNGWTITKNSEGWWVYANGNDGTKILSSNTKLAEALKIQIFLLFVLIITLLLLFVSVIFISGII